MMILLRTLTFSVLILSAVALLASGCGGAKNTDSKDAASKDAATSTGSADGKALFQSSCGGCHTLADADTQGAAGPNLDKANTDEAHVKEMIVKGGGAMPAGLLEGKQADTVAAYVASAAKKK